LRQIGNFNGLLEIISGLNRGPVFRLKQTFDQLDQKDNKRFLQLEELKMITNRERNYAELRRAFKAMEPPIIPYLGMFVALLPWL
jgi:son of sevenless-like protein